MSAKRSYVLACCAALALPAASRAVGLTPGDILVTTDQSSRPADMLYEYTTGGALVASYAVPYPTTPRDGYPHDIAVDSAGNVQIFNGVFSPVLTTFAPGAGTFTHHSADFSIVNNASYGGVAVAGRYVFVGDMNTAGSPNVGIVRFDAANGYAATRVQSTIEYERVSMGANGLLYAVSGDEPYSSPGIDAYDPATMALVRTVPLPGTDPRAVAVAPDGDLFIADWGGTVYHDSPTGARIASRDIGMGSLADIDISPTGQLVIGTRDGHVVLTDTSLGSQASFQPSFSTVFVAFTSPVPEPTVGAGIVVTGVLMLARRRIRGGASIASATDAMPRRGKGD